MGFRDTLANLVGWGQSTRALTAGDIFLSTEAPIEFYDVGGDNALRISAVYSAVGLIADALSKPSDDPARVALAQEAQRLFRDDFMFIPWYKQTMSRWANANVAGMEKNLDWQIVAPWAISIS